MEVGAGYVKVSVYMMVHSSGVGARKGCESGKWKVESGNGMALGVSWLYKVW